MNGFLAGLLLMLLALLLAGRRRARRRRRAAEARARRARLRRDSVPHVSANLRGAAASLAADRAAEERTESRLT